ncbi:MAG: T9SS type A sorting domain-containing protein [Saprospiraceae bacterium]|nr:T9SS type A sorting domain-containing protein [Saprospiraceae bacterium]
MKINHLFFLVLFCSATAVQATTHRIGPNDTYNSPNALYNAGVVQDGDTIEIEVATYSGTASLAVWQRNDLVIRGIGGRPHLVADGQYIWGKGIWVLAGNDITVENIEFSGATVPDQNGAGIRLDGTGMTVRHCYFHHNQNGILTSNPNAGEILIEYTEFAYSGYGDGYTHNVYVGHVEKLTFRFNYSHHAIVGHNLKSRARENFIYCNRIMDEEDGQSSRLIDLPNGGLSIVMGNLLMEGPQSENNNLIGYGLEGLSNDGPHEFYFVNNSAVSKRPGNTLFLHVIDGTEVVNVSNNIFAYTGAATLLNGTATTELTNLFLPDLVSAGFADDVSYDYTLLPSSPAIDAGTTLTTLASGHSLTPDHAYIHPTAEVLRQVVGNSIDLGAFEFGEPSAIEETIASASNFYPNPTIGWLYAVNGVQQIRVFDAMGRGAMLAKGAAIDLTPLRSGLYLVLAQSGEQNILGRVLKH